MDQGAREFLLATEKRLSDRMEGISARVQDNADRITEEREDLNAKLESHKRETKEEIEESRTFGD